MFISNRPGEHIHNEISITMGFPMKDGGDAEADIAGTTFDLIAKGRNAWIENPAEEGHFVAALATAPSSSSRPPPPEAS